MNKENERLVYGDLLDYLDLAFPEASLDRVSRFYMRLLNQKTCLLECFIAFVISNKGFTYDSPMSIEDFDEDEWIEEFSRLPIQGPHWRFPPFFTSGKGWNVNFVKNGQKLVVTVLSGIPGGTISLGGGSSSTFGEELAKEYSRSREENGVGKLFLATNRNILKKGKKELETLTLEENVLVGVGGLLDKFTDTDNEKETLRERWKSIRKKILRNFKDEEPILKGAQKPKGGILSEIEKGEGEELEFKETLLHDVNQEKKKKKLKRECVKEICAFANAWGGKLIVGVDDDKNVKGLKRDFQYIDNKAEFKKRLFDVIKGNVSKNFANESVKISFKEIEGKKICIVKVNPSSDPIFFDEDDFFVRIGTSKESLSGKERADYIARNFPNRSRD